MTMPAEIEAAADSLSSEDKEALLRFLAMRLRKERALPPPGIYADDEMAAMLAEDEADGTRLREESHFVPRSQTRLENAGTRQSRPPPSGLWLPVSWQPLT